MFEELFLSLLGMSPLLVEEIYPDSAVINNRLGPLYGVRVVSNTERAKTLGSDAVARLVATDPAENRRLLYLILRRFRIKGKLYTDLHYLTHSKEVHTGLLNLLKKAGVEMKGYEIGNLLLSSLLLRPEVSLDDRLLKTYKNFMVFTQEDEGVPLREKSLAIVKEFSTQDVHVFVGSGIAGEPDWERLLRLDFQGVLYITLDLNDQLLSIKRKKGVSQTHRRVWQEMEEDYRKGYRPVGLYSFFITRESPELAADVMYATGFYSLEKVRTRPIFALGTINFRDESYTFLVDQELAGKYLLYSYEKTSLPENVEVYGKNRYGSFVVFSPFEENQNPHAVIFAPSGAGKSFGIQNYLSTLARIDVKSLYEGVFADNLKVRVRHFDKGYSAELFYKLLKARGYDVAMFSASLDRISLNPVQVSSPTVEDVEFSVSVINACLEAVNLTPLSGYELPWFIYALKKVAGDPELQVFRHHRVSLLNSKEYEPLKEVYRKIRSMGFKDTDYIGELPRDFDFLKVPLLDDLIRLLSSHAQSQRISSEEQDAIRKLVSKLNVLSQQPMLSCPTQVDIRADKVVYLDFEELSKSRFFVPIVLTILNLLVREDKYRKPEEERAYYIIDEAHNMLRNPHFNQALKILTREARKFRISMMYLTQFFEEIPPEVIFNADTIMFLSPQEEQKRRQYLNNFYAHVRSSSDERLTLASDLEYVYNAVPPYTFVVWYSQGVFSMNLDVDPVKLMVFDSYRKELITPDRVRLTKSSLREV